MKYTRAKAVKKTPLGKPSPPSKGSKIPKAKPRILGVGTFQKKEHAPRVI
jgi:hypothetical protein